jgi:glutathione S-transferase
MPLKLYGLLKSRASRVVWTANELDVPYELIPVVQAYRLADPNAPNAPLNTSSSSFRKINPNGLIPTIDDGGFLLHESLAITLYLAKKHGGPLAPRDAREESLMTMWALWAATEVEPHSLLLLRHRRDYPPEKRDPAIARECIAALRRPFAVLQDALSKGSGHLVGSRFTIADLNTAEVMRYAQVAPELFEEFPVIEAWLKACQARPAFQAMLAARNAEPDP